MTLLQLQERMSHLWAKSSFKPGAHGVTLFQHSLDVVFQMAEYYRLYRPEWPLGDQPVCLPRILAYAALVHDFGKIHVDFQAMLKCDDKMFRNRHEILSLAFLADLEIDCLERAWLEAAVALHHKNLFWLTAPGQWFYYQSEHFAAQTSHVSNLVSGVMPEDAALLREFLSHAGEVFEQRGWTGFSLYDLRTSPCVDRISCIHDSLQRIDQLAKKFECRRDEFDNVLDIPWPERHAAVRVRGFILNSDHLASFQPHLLQAGLQKVNAVEQALTNKISEFNGHQQQAAAHRGSAILIAPTGSGKTEAALLWAARQGEDGLRGRTFILLPYQASMNAMQKRVIEDFLPDLVKDPGTWNQEIALVHGRSMRTVYERITDRDDKDYSLKQAVHIAHLQNDLARLNVAPIRVCSPYQIIRLLFATRGVEGLLLSLTQSRLIFDEIHAYDPEVTAMALTAAQFLVEHFGARVLFMTATLPSHLKQVLSQMFSEATTIPVDTEILNRPARHRVNLQPHSVFSATALEQIRIAARSKSVLVVVNQVSRAIKLFELLNDLGDARRLLHSRFAYKDRFQAEKKISPQTGRVLIATQAVEVSLDLDYDVCFSELAPVESLLQRFGRCNRHSNQTAPADVSVFLNFPEGSAHPWYPYEKAHLEQTKDTLQGFIKEHPSATLEEAMITPLLDQSYPRDLQAKLHSVITDKTKKLKESFIEPFMPFGAADSTHTKVLDQQWEELFDGEEVLPESLLPEALQEDSWLARARYLVPISAKALWRLRSAQKVEWNQELMCYVAKTPYTQYGLEL